MSEEVERLRGDFLLRAGSPVFRLGAVPDCALGPCSIAIGAFDGFHIGHARLMREAVKDARRRNISSVAVTFDPDPDCVVGPAPALKLLDSAARLRALSSSGVDAVLVVPFTAELAALDHAAFFERVLASAMEVVSVHVGSDFRLGRGGASTVDIIAAWGAARGIDVVGHDLVLDDGRRVCATRIRAALSAGQLDEVRRELGRRPLIEGVVGPGRGQGTGMGFPTANIIVPPGMQMPADGVYSAYALVDGEAWPSAVNVGIPPMFAGSAESARLEANLLGFSGDLYGRRIALAFDRFLRPSVRFESTAELIETVLSDISYVAASLAPGPIHLGSEA